MKKAFVLIAAVLFLSSPAFAFHCPPDMKEIDTALAKKMDLNAKQMKEVKELRATGEALHKSGKHNAAVAVLARAMEILGLR